jgi:periplasmic protein TonB
MLDTVYIKPEIPASFPGGLPSWSKYLQRNLDKNLVKRNGGPPGKYTVLINFLVNADGTISNIRAINDPGYGAKIEAMRMIAKGPNWKPALVKGRQVGSQHEISITFFVPKSA